MRERVPSFDLPEPCSKSWDDMSPVRNGRHCHSCDHLVVDFEGWKPEEIRNYLMTHRNTCGRIEERQLKPLRKGYRRLRMASVVLLLLGLSSPSTAQSDSLKFEKTKPATLTVPRPGSKVEKPKAKPKRRRFRRKRKKVVVGRYVGFLENKME